MKATVYQSVQKAFPKGLAKELSSLSNNSTKISKVQNQAEAKLNQRADRKSHRAN